MDRGKEGEKGERKKGINLTKLNSKTVITSQE